MGIIKRFRKLLVNIGSVRAMGNTMLRTLFFKPPSEASKNRRVRMMRRIQRSLRFETLTTVLFNRGDRGGAQELLRFVTVIVHQSFDPILDGLTRPIETLDTPQSFRLTGGPTGQLTMSSERKMYSACRAIRGHA